MRRFLALLLLGFLASCSGELGSGPAGSETYVAPFDGPVQSMATAGPPASAGGPGPRGSSRDLPPLDRRGGPGPNGPEAPFADALQGRGSPPPPPSYLLLGPGSRGAGWVEAKNLPTGGAAPTFAAWGRVPWDAYNAVDGTVFPAVGDIDGDGRDEIVLGLGPAGQGWAYVLDDTATGMAGLGWLQLRNWPQYTSSGKAPVYPACVDIDGDGRDEIVLGTDSGGWVEIFRYAGNGAFTPFTRTPVAGGYLQVSWSSYTSGAAPVHPAGGNLDGLGGEELVLGLGDRGSAWAQVWTYNGSTMVPYAGAGAGGWLQVDWASYAASGRAPVYPACGDLDQDGKDDLVLGMGAGGSGWVRVLRSTGSAFEPLSGGWRQVPWTAYCLSGDAPTYPACGDLDGDTRDDLIVGLGGKGLGWACAFRGGTLSPPDWGWARSSWASYANTAPAPIYPAIAHGHGAVLTRIDINPPAAETPVGVTLDLTAQGTFSDGTTGDVTSSVDWSVDDANLAQIDENGSLTALAPGTTRVTAASQGITASVPLTVSAAILQTLQVTPIHPSVPAGLTLQLAATGHFSDGSTAPMADAVEWASEDSGLATVDTLGLVTGVQPGSVAVRATLGGVTGSTVLQVTDAELDSLQIEPVDASIPDGLTLQFTATGHFTDGSTRPVTDLVTWSCDAPSIATVDAAGLATALDPGDAIVTATLGPIASTRALRVTDAELTSIQITPVASTLAKGLTLQLTAEGHFSDNSTRPLTDQVSWWTSAPEVALVVGGQVTAVEPGPARIEARLDGIVGSAELTVTPAELVSLEVGPVSPTLVAGLTLPMQAVGRYTDGSTPDLTGVVTWTSSDPTRAEVELTTGLLTALASGTTTIQAALDGKTAATEVTVTDAELVSLRIIPANRSLARGLTLQYQAEGTFTDGSELTLTDQVTWASSQEAASISNVPGSRGLATALVQGVTSIEASLGAVQASTELTVTEAELVSLTVTPSDSSLPASLSRQFVASGRFTDGSVALLTDQVSWESTDPTRASITPTGLVTGLLAGSTTIRAWKDSLSGETGLTVSNAVIVGLELRPQPASTPAGVPIQIYADAVYSDGFRSDVTENVTWIPLSSTASISNLPGSKGELSDRQEGLAVFSATFGSFEEVGTATILPAIVDHLEVSPDPVLIGRQDRVDFSAFKVYSDDRRELVEGGVSWTSQNPAVVVVDARGRASGVDTGVTTVTATVDGFTGQATVRNSGLPSVSFEGCYPTLPAADSSDLQLADLNQDGQLDLVLVTETRLGLGGGAFGPSIPHTALTISGAQFVVADFDEDGKPDAYSRASFYRGKGDGTFMAGRLASQFPSGSQNSLATGDLNHDGHMDVVVGTENQNLVTVMFGLGNGDFVRGSETDSGGGSTGLVLADFNLDGWLDAAVVNNGQGSLLTMLNDGSGSLAAAQTFSVGVTPGTLAAGDVTGDGLVDLVVPGDALCVLVGNGSGSFGLTQVAVPSPMSRAFLLDLTGDGRTDVVLERRGVSLFEQQANGSLTYAQSWALGDSFQVRVADLDGDGRVDLVACQKGRLAFLYADGSGGLRAPRAYPSLFPNANMSPAAADFDEDGCADVAVPCGMSVELQFGSGSGDLVRAQILSQPARLVATGDCNGDGHADLILASSSAVSFLAGHGDGTFAAPISRNISQAGDLRTCDFDHNSALEILVATDSRAVVLKVTPTQLNVAANFTLSMLDLQRVASGDVNGDGLMDIVFDSLDFGYARKFTIATGQAGGGFVSSQSFSWGALGYGVDLGDLNGDGLSDLLLNGDNPLWTSLSVAGRFTGFVSLQPSPIPLGTVRALDLNGDGYLDAATDGATFLGTGTGEMTYGQTCSAGLGYSVLADVDGDGRLDRVSGNVGWLAVQRGR